MTIGGPRMNEGLLPLGGGRVLGYNHAAGMHYIQERRAVGFPDIYWLFDREEDLPPGVGEDEVGMLDEGEGFPPQQGGQLAAIEEEEEEEDDEEDEELDDDWESEDSGYGSVSEDEEDFEEDDEEDIRPRSPLVQQLNPGRFQQGWREEDPPVPAPPPVAGPWSLEHPAHRAGPPPEGRASEESAPSTWGPDSSSAKRSREDSHMEQVSMKRERRNCEEGHEESAPSTSGRSDDDSYMDSAPSTSGLGPSTLRGHWMHPFSYEAASDDSDSD